MTGTILIGEDYSHHNSNFDLKHIKENDFFVWLKGTQGVDFIDPTLMDRKILLSYSNIPIGIYHFITGDNPIWQVNHYLLTCVPNGLFIGGFDLEHNVTEPSNNATLGIASAMVTYFYKLTGFYPVLYTSGTALGSMYMTCLKRLGKTIADANLKVLIHCPLWNISPNVPYSKPSQWSKATFNQFTKENNIDQDEFFGDENQLEAFWKNNIIKLETLEVTVKATGGLNIHSEPKYTKKTGKTFSDASKLVVDVNEQTPESYGFSSYNWVKLHGKDIYVERSYLR